MVEIDDDYLDNILDDFNVPILPKQPKQEEDEFLLSLTKGMEELLSQNQNIPLSQIDHLQAGFADLFTPQTENDTPQSDNSFQSKVTNTLNKLKDSTQKADADVLTNDISDSAGMEQMMKELEKLMESGEMDKVFGMDDVMGEIITKDLLYEPLKELSMKYPAWIKSNKMNISVTELARINGQFETLLNIIQVFDDADDKLSEEESKKITDLLQIMQDFGNPPAELMPMMDLEGGDGGLLGSDGKNCMIM